jgi:hypothetical protein
VRGNARDRCLVLASVELFMSDDLRPSLRGRGQVILPEIVVEDMTLPADNILKPIFVLVWNARASALARSDPPLLARLTRLEEN